MHYTAKEVARKLQEEGYWDVTARTVNYYAFEKKMFDVPLTGKSCFTEKEIEKIKAIKRLQKTTNFTLEQIKEIINKYDYKDIVERTSPIVYETPEDFYRSPGYMQSLASNIQTSSISGCLQQHSQTGTFSVAPINISRTYDSQQTNQYVQRSQSRGCPNIDYQPSQTPGETTTGMYTSSSTQRILRVNQDITLIVSDKVDTDTLTQIVKSIQQITQKP